jgi:hypothetical protein
MISLSLAGSTAVPVLGDCWPDFVRRAMILPARAERGRCAVTGEISPVILLFTPEELFSDFPPDTVLFLRSLASWPTGTHHLVTNNNRMAYWHPAPLPGQWQCKRAGGTDLFLRRAGRRNQV